MRASPFYRDFEEWPLFSMTSATESSRVGFSEALLVGLITATAYVAVYSYESSVCVHFGIPQSLIKISTEVLIGSFLAVSGFVLSALFLVNIVLGFLVPSKRDPDSLLHTALVAHAGIACFGVLLFNAIGFTLKRVMYFVGVIVIIDLILTITILIVVFFVSRLAKRLPAVERQAVLKEVAEDPPVDLWILLRRYVQRQYLFAVLCLFGVVLLADFAGTRVARLQKEFFFVEPKNLVIVRAYADAFVCKPIVGEQSEKLGAATVILKLEQLTDVPVIVKRFVEPPEVEKP